MSYQLDRSAEWSVIPSLWIVRFNVPPLFIVPPPREREHVPRGSVPPSTVDWQEW